VVQLLVPVLSLFLLSNIGKALSELVKEYAEVAVNPDLPYIFGLDYRTFSNLEEGDLKFEVSNCDKWFLTHFNESASEVTKSFVGMNEGSPWHNVASSGQLLSASNLLQTPCPMVQRQVPYFRDFDASINSENETRWASIDEYLFKHLDHLSDSSFRASDRNNDGDPDVQQLPDGVFVFTEAGPKGLEYDFRVNDNHVYQYHRSNGFTKIGVHQPDLNLTQQVFRVLEASIEAPHIINKAYIKSLFPQTTVVTGVSAYPF
jgi:hypothetical protein